jgi:GNAT superfamily N-acetyltransferase
MTSTPPSSTDRLVSEPLSPRHLTDRFDSGQPALDLWLRVSAWRGQAQDTGRTWVWHVGDDVVLAYFTLSGHTLDRLTLSRGQGRSLPARIPAILLAKLALDRSLQGHGLGGDLLADALARCVVSGESVAARFVVVDAIDDQAAKFYTKFGFTPLPGEHSRRLTRRLASIRSDFEAAVQSLQTGRPASRPRRRTRK